VIADDGDNDKKVAELIPGDDPRIKYVNCKVDPGKHLSLAKKLNLCMAYAEQESEYFLVFSDDCYYPPHSVLSRVKTLMTYSQPTSQPTQHTSSQSKACVGSTQFGMFDIEKNESYISHFDDARGNPTILTMPSLAFSKQFYENRRFDETSLAFPSFQFCVGRFQEVIEIPYEFIYIQLYSSKVVSDIKYDTHSNGAMNKNTFLHKSESAQNKEKQKQQEKKHKNQFSFFDTWDKDTREFVLLIKETI
jgi:hypothetical protein